MTLPPDISCLSSSEKDTLIGALMARLQALEARVSALEVENAALRTENATLAAENAALREKLNLPPKTPDNSSKPPSQGQKANGETTAKPKGKAHAGAHRRLHPNPTRRRDVLAEHCPHCRADVTGVVQAEVQAYDRIEIPEITPDAAPLLSSRQPLAVHRALRSMVRAPNIAIPRGHGFEVTAS